MNPEDLDNPDWEPPSKYRVCPLCGDLYEWYWDTDNECWWPGEAEWWFNSTLGLKFICSRKCYLASLEKMTT